MSASRPSGCRQSLRACGLLMLLGLGFCGFSVWATHEPQRAAYRAQAAVRPGMTVSELVATTSPRGLSTLRVLGAAGEEGPIYRVHSLERGALFGPDGAARRFPDLTRALEETIASVTTASGWTVGYRFPVIHSEVRSFAVELGPDGRVRLATPVKHESY